MNKMKKCEECGKSFEYEAVKWQGKEIMPPKRCQACCDSEQAKKDADNRAEMAQEAFFEICPPLYRKTDVKRLPRAISAQIAKWEYGPIGLGIVGNPGIGKTRAAYMLLKRMIWDGHDVGAAGITEFNDLCVQQFQGIDEEREDALARIRQLRHADITFIDDIGKGKMTERAEMELYTLLEHRTSYELPTIWTANSNSAELSKAMSKERGAPILRRLLEFSEVIP